MTQIPKDRPMPRSGLNDPAMRLIEQRLRKANGLRSAAGRTKTLGWVAILMTEESHLRRDSERRGGAIDHGRQPVRESFVVRRIRPERIQENVDVRKDQWRSSITSRRLALLSRSTPGRTPPRSRLTGRTILFRRTGGPPLSRQHETQSLLNKSGQCLPFLTGLGFGLLEQSVIEPHGCSHWCPEQDMSRHIVTSSRGEETRLVAACPSGIQAARYDLYDVQ